MPMFAPATDQTEVNLPEPGKYIVTCINIEDAPDKGFGPGVKWVFRLEDFNTGEVWDSDLWQFTSIKMGPKAKARPIIEGLLGRALEVHEVPNADHLIGRKMIAMVIHEPRDDGSLRAVVTSCKPITDQRQASAPSPAQARRQSSPPSSAPTIREQLTAAIRKATILQTPQHLDWAALNLDAMTDGDMASFLDDVNADIQAA